MLVCVFLRLQTSSGLRFFVVVIHRHPFIGKLLWKVKTITTVLFYIKIIIIAYCLCGCMCVCVHMPFCFILLGVAETSICKRMRVQDTERQREWMRRGREIERQRKEFLHGCPSACLHTNDTIMIIIVIVFFMNAVSSLCILPNVSITYNIVFLMLCWLFFRIYSLEMQNVLHMLSIIYAERKKEREKNGLTIWDRKATKVRDTRNEERVEKGEEKGRERKKNHAQTRD